MPVNYTFAYAHPATQHYRQRRAWKVAFLANIWKYGIVTCDSVCPYDRWVTVKKWKGEKAITIHFQCCIFLQNISSTSWNTPWSHEAMKQRYCILHGSGKRNGEQRKQREALIEPWCEHWSCSGWQKKHVSGWSAVEQWRNQAHSLSGYWVMLIWRHQSDSQSVSRKIC